MILALIDFSSLRSDAKKIRTESVEISIQIVSFVVSNLINPWRIWERAKNEIVIPSRCSALCRC
jgi:hypothetical protein